MILFGANGTRKIKLASSVRQTILRKCALMTAKFVDRKSVQTVGVELSRLLNVSITAYMHQDQERYRLRQQKKGNNDHPGRRRQLANSGAGSFSPKCGFQVYICVGIVNKVLKQLHRLPSFSLVQVNLISSSVFCVVNAPSDFGGLPPLTKREKLRHKFWSQDSGSFLINVNTTKSEDFYAIIMS